MFLNEGLAAASQRGYRLCADADAMTYKLQAQREGLLSPMASHKVHSRFQAGIKMKVWWMVNPICIDIERESTAWAVKRRGDAGGTKARHNSMRARLKEAGNG